MSTAPAEPPFEELEDQPAIGPPRWWLHILLFVLTCMTTFMVGMNFSDGSYQDFANWQKPEVLLGAASYMVCVMLIIFAHEMGHYLMAKRYRINVSPPYFIPGLAIPFVGVVPFLGTLGAFIQLELKPLSAKKLLDVGAWGPLAGFIPTVPILFLGISLSEIKPKIDGQGISLGNNLLTLIANAMFFPDVPEGHDVFFHPVAMAGWMGCFLTAYNLLPLGQLDGGHIAYTVFGERFNKVAPWIFRAFVLLGLIWFSGWLVLGLLVWYMGPRHPRIIEGELVRGRNLWLAVVSAVLFVLTFFPEPIHGFRPYEVLAGLFF